MVYDIIMFYLHFMRINFTITVSLAFNMTLSDIPVAILTLSAALDRLTDCLGQSSSELCRVDTADRHDRQAIRACPPEAHWSANLNALYILLLECSCLLSLAAALIGDVLLESSRRQPTCLWCAKTI